MRLGDLPEPWRDDPYLVGEHAAAELTAWADDRAVLAVVDGPGRGRGLIGLGDPAGVAAHAARVTAERHPAVDGLWFATLERGTFEAMDADVAVALGFPTGGASWDWMWTDRPLAADPTGAERLPAGPDTVAEVAECLSRAHPTASTAPDDERLMAWWGVRREGRLMAVVGAIQVHGLPPHLVSLGVDPVTRGQGLAGVVMGAAVRDCLEVVPDVGPPMVSLGLYADNDVARRVYTRLGFRLEHGFTSRRRAG